VYITAGYKTTWKCTWNRYRT